MLTLEQESDIYTSDKASTFTDFRKAYHSRLRYTPIQSPNSTDYLVRHSFQQCIQCARELKPIGSAAYDYNLDGDFFPECNGFIHYTCYREIRTKEENIKRSKEDIIYTEVNDAATNGTLYEYCPINITPERNRKYCTYCNGLLQEINPGFKYKSDLSESNEVDEWGFKYIHNTCYNKISSRPKYNLDAYKKWINDVDQRHEYEIEQEREDKMSVIL